MADASEEELRALRRQEPAAFARLVETHQATVLGLAQSLGLRGADLDDAAAEAFAQVYHALPRFAGHSELGTWVYRIAYRTILKLRHRRQRHATAELPEEQPDAAQDLPGDEPERRETYEALWAAVDRLEPRQAAAVELFYRREMNIEEVAAVMECPAGTVKTLLFRARQTLRAALERQEMHP